MLVGNHKLSGYIGDPVFLKNFGAGSRWLPGEIVETSGPVSLVLLEDRKHRRCHQDQLRLRVVDDGPPEMSQIPVEEPLPISTPTEPVEESTATSADPGAGPPDSLGPGDSLTENQSSGTATRCCPKRQRKPRERFHLGGN